MKKGRVNRLLNVRTRVPRVLPDNNPGDRFFRPGDVVTIAATVTGDCYKELDEWYQLEDGAFIWSGGVDLAPESARTASAENIALEDRSKMSWGHLRYDLPFIWKDLGTRGEGITVGIIDSGIDSQHPDLKPNIHSLSKSFVGQPTDISDTRGHGTQMAGMIAACGKDKVFGVAPEAKLLVVKVSVSADGNIQSYIDGIEYLSRLQIDILSISTSFLQLEDDALRIQQLKLMKEKLQVCLDKKVIVVAAIGDLHTTSPDEDTFPACYDVDPDQKKNLLAVGSFDVNGGICNFSNRSRHLDLLAPGDDNLLTTVVGGGAGPGAKTSIATAFVSGCLALMLSYQRKQPSASIPAVEALLQSCDDTGPEINKDMDSGHGLLNFRNAIAKIKTR